jgi:anti-sigma-K factor RskA
VNVQEYISSGIVESYVFGLANQEEQAEFERMCSTYPEVREARETFELLLEKQALAQAVEPPARLKNKIFDEIGIEPVKLIAKPGFPQAIVTPPVSTTPVVKMGWLRFVAAAAVVLLFASTALNFYFFSQYREYGAKYDQLIASQNQVASANQALQTKLSAYESALRLIRDPQMAVIKMPGVPTSPDQSSMATIYWDTRSKDVYLLVNNLPQPVTGKQYQLWALVDGKPVDAGMVDMKDGVSFVKMKNIQKAQAFAITLEKEGGSATPTMQAMYVLGKVTG